MRWNDRESTLELGDQEGTLHQEQRLRIRKTGTDIAREIRYTGEKISVQL